jgi:hypothetical protein
MARERAKLSDKQERILVQCQLMGLTTNDMAQISNRLRALENERELIAQINEYSAGKIWKKLDTNSWQINSSDGYEYIFKKAAKSKGRQSYWDRNVTDWDIWITKPGTRYKSRSLTNVGIGYYEKVTARICPDNSKDLFSILRKLHTDVLA